MRPLGLAWRTLTRQPARTLLGIAGIAATGALLFDMLLLSRGLLISFEDLLDSLDFDVRVISTETLPGAAPALENAGELIASIAALPEVEEVIDMRFRGLVALDGRAGSVGLFAVGGTRRYPWTVLQGRDLAETDGDRPPPLLVNDLVAEEYDLSPGDTVRARPLRSGTAVLPPREFRIAGVARFPFDSASQLNAATTMPAFLDLTDEAGTDRVDMLLIASSARNTPAATVDAIRRIRPDVYAFTNQQFLDRFARTDFSYFRQISFVLSAMTLFFSFLLVTALLTVSVNQRFVEVAALRALGFRRRRIAADLLWESALLVGTGTALSLPLGALLAYWLDGILRDIPGIPASLHFFVFYPGALGRQVTLMAVAAVLASSYPVYLAARLPIASTLRREVVS